MPLAIGGQLRGRGIAKRFDTNPIGESSKIMVSLVLQLPWNNFDDFAHLCDVVVCDRVSENLANQLGAQSWAIRRKDMFNRLWRKCNQGRLCSFWVDDCSQGAFVLVLRDKGWSNFQAEVLSSWSAIYNLKSPD